MDIIDFKSELMTAKVPGDLPPPVTFKTPAHIVHKNVRNTEFIGMNVIGENKKAFYNNVLFENCSNIKISKGVFDDAGLYGLEIRDCEDVLITDCHFMENKYGGLCVSGCTAVNIEDCTFVRNGNSIAEGYGIALTGAYSKNTNKSISIGKCVFRDNRRKGLDVHNGGFISCTDSVFDNWGNDIYAHIGAVSQSETKDVFGHLRIENCIMTGSAVRAVELGSYNDGAASPIHAQNVTMRNCFIRGEYRCGVEIKTPKSGLTPGVMTFESNSFELGASAKYGIVVGVDGVKVGDVRLIRNSFIQRGKTIPFLMTGTKTWTELDNKIYMLKD